ncbi:BQ2448_2450 [Microbotryum intermedium]|uniref:BQ2448_2450 protein n=1 Tax=Microbotryum intermedium TaxID=269621 RepID=A0A238F6C9_9BASI|nr:BQ2448_2450 [Microbotryum intermedium]
MSLCSLASYLASLNAPVVATPGPNSPLESSAGSESHSASSLEGSPTKRARAESPDTSVASSSHAEYFVPLSGIHHKLGGEPTPSTQLLTASNLLAASSPAHSAGSPVLRSILTQTPLHPDAAAGPGPSSAGGLSEPTSRPLSRRSSTGASSTTKSVRFARCTNASVFAALSVEEYDRSPIIPTCESESLELPKRQNREEDGWIKCVERERAAAAKRIATGQSLPALSPSMDNPVEGKHGLLEGGYFVGGEREEHSSDEDEDMMVVDDEETGEIHDTPGRIQDDSSGDDESDGILSITSEQNQPILRLVSSQPSSFAPTYTISPVSDTDLLKHATLNAAVCAAITLTTPVVDLTPTASPALPSTATFGPTLAPGAEAESTGVESSTDDSSPIEASAEEEGDADAAAVAARIQREKKEKAKKCRERYGLCALGKYSRAEVFSSYDSLGGF